MLMTCFRVVFPVEKSSLDGFTLLPSISLRCFLAGFSTFVRNAKQINLFSGLCISFILISAKV